MNNLAIDVGDDRFSGRLDINVAAGLRTAGGRRVPVLLRNVSPYGFMAEGGATMVPGSPVMLHLFDGTSFEARIIWKRDGHVGAAFVSPLTDEMLAAVS